MSSGPKAKRYRPPSPTPSSSSRDSEDIPPPEDLSAKERAYVIASFYVRCVSGDWGVCPKSVRTELEKFPLDKFEEWERAIIFGVSSSFVRAPLGRDCQAPGASSAQASEKRFTHECALRFILRQTRDWDERTRVNTAAYELSWVCLTPHEDPGVPANT